MRLPFTLSELSVIRSGGRVFVQLFGVVAVLLGLWAATVILDRSLQPVDEELEATRVSSLTDPEGSFLTFPAEAELVHEDGRTLQVILVNRPSMREVTVQRKSDGRTFVIDLAMLQSESADSVRRFPVANGGNSLQSLINQFQTHLVLPENRFQFPHRCTLVSKDGIALPVTLLSREDESSITFRRKSDGRIFSLDLSRLVESDRHLVRQFPLASAVPDEPLLDEGLDLP